MQFGKGNKAILSLIVHNFTVSVKLVGNVI